MSRKPVPSLLTDLIEHANRAIYLRGTRNIIAHGYDILDWDILDAVLRTHLPELVRIAEPILDSFGPPPEID